MASDGCHCDRGMADRIAAARSTNERVCILQLEQPAVGLLGRLCSGVCLDRVAGVSFRHEPSRTKEKRERQRK